MKMSSFVYQRPLHNPLSNPSSSSPPSPSSSPTKNTSKFFNKPTLLIITLSLFIFTGLVIFSTSLPLLSLSSSSSKWNRYTLSEAAAYVARNGTVIVCAVSGPYLPFLSNWLISVSRTGHHEKVLVIAEDYSTLYKVNDRWPGHAVLVPPAPDAQVAHKFGSQDRYNETVFLIAEDYATLYKVIDRWPSHVVLMPPAPEAQKAHKFGSWGFFNFTSRRPRHLLQLLELGYNVLYNDVDMVWLADPFPYMQGSHDVYFTDDMTAVKPLDHSHDLPPVNSKGRTYICSCMIFLRPTSGAKLVMNKWIEELKDQPWSRAKKANDQPGFNWALMKTAGQVDLYLLPQAAFPTGGLYFKNKTWVQETKGKHVIIHNNYIIGFEKKIKRFRDFGLWLVDDHAEESPLGKI